MKRIIVLALIIMGFGFAARAQMSLSVDSPSNNNFKEFHLAQASVEIQRLHKSYMTGMLMTAGGLALNVAASPLLADEEAGGVVLSTVGSISLIGGIVVLIVAHKHIKIAGQELQFAGTGVGIPISTPRKRH